MAGFFDDLDFSIDFSATPTLDKRGDAKARMAKLEADLAMAQAHIDQMITGHGEELKAKNHRILELELLVGKVREAWSGLDWLDTEESEVIDMLLGVTEKGEK